MVFNEPASELDLNKIRHIYVEEKNSADLTQLQPDFYEKANLLVRTIKEKAKKTRSVEALREFQNLQRLVREILENRERKIITYASVVGTRGLSKLSLTLEENELFHSIVASIQKFRHITNYRSLCNIDEKTKIKITDNIPEYIGKDNNKYGPYKKGDIVELPQDEALYLIDNGLAVEE